MPLLLDLCNESAHGKSPALIEHRVTRRELVPQASLGSPFLSSRRLHDDPSSRSIVQLCTYFISLAADEL